MEKRRRFSPEKKVEILRERLKNDVPLSEICKKYDIHPNQFYRWEKRFFEGGIEVFSNKKERKKETRENKFKEKIKNMEGVISWLTEENIKLKKKESGEI